MDITAALNRAIIAARAGRKAEARRLLEAVLDVDERNERAWLWLSRVLESEAERIVCLKNVLVINPNNELARKGLADIQAGIPSPDLVAGRSPSSGRSPVAEASPGGEMRGSPATGSASTPDVPGRAPPPGHSPPADNRVFIVITIMLALMLLCTVASIVLFVTLSPLG